jgi:hypothetical protein
MRFLIALAVFFYSFCATAATLGQHVTSENRTHAACSGTTPIPTLDANIVISTAGRLVKIDWSAWAVFNGIRAKLLYCAGASCTPTTQIARWPDTTVPTNNNQDWFFCTTCYLGLPLSGTHTTGGLTATTHKFRLAWDKFNNSQACNHVTNRTLHLQEIIP